MPGTDDGVVLRPSRWGALVGPVFLITNGLSFGFGVHWLFLFSVPIGVLGLAPALRARTVLEPSGVSVCNGVRTTHFPWAEIAGVANHGRGGLDLRDGPRIPLPGMLVRPVVPAGYVRSRTAQEIADYARAHGADVELRSTPEPPTAG